MIVEAHFCRRTAISIFVSLGAMQNEVLTAVQWDQRKWNFKINESLYTCMHVGTV